MLNYKDLFIEAKKSLDKRVEEERRRKQIIDEIGKGEAEKIYSKNEDELYKLLRWFIRSITDSLHAHTFFNGYYYFTIEDVPYGATSVICERISELLINDLVELSPKFCNYTVEKDCEKVEEISSSKKEEKIYKTEVCLRIVLTINYPEE